MGYGTVGASTVNGLTAAVLETSRTNKCYAEIRKRLVKSPNEFSKNNI